MKVHLSLYNKNEKEERVISHLRQEDETILKRKAKNISFFQSGWYNSTAGFHPDKRQKD